MTNLNQPILDFKQKLDQLPGLPTGARTQIGNLPNDISGVLPQPLDPRESELTAMAVVSDAAGWALGFIPWVGDILSDIVSDNIEANISRRLSPTERVELIEQNRFMPTSLAIYRVFTKGKAGKL